MFGVIMGLLALQPVIAPAESARLTPQTTFHSDGRGTPRVDFVTEEARLHGLIALPSHERPIAPERMAEDYLKLNYLRYGLSPTLSELTLVGCRRSLLGHHCRFQESMAGHDVIEAELNVSMDLNSRVTKVVNTTHPLAGGDRIATEARIPAAEILQLIETDAKQKAILSVPRLTYLPRADGFALVYETHATLRAPVRFVRYLVDAQSGEILRCDDEASDHGGRDGRDTQ
ncbi:MAG: hypothetical protein Q7T86_17080 [Hyphomicrobiaceae bacterium]|nr:hypothetical protein [Hyphomicrobiaceae bacterium]